MLDITRDKPIKVAVRVAVPVRDHPKVCIRKNRIIFKLKTRKGCLETCENCTPQAQHYSFFFYYNLMYPKHMYYIKYGDRVHINFLSEKYVCTSDHNLSVFYIQIFGYNLCDKKKKNVSRVIEFRFILFILCVFFFYDFIVSYTITPSSRCRIYSLISLESYWDRKEIQ